MQPLERGANTKVPSGRLDVLVEWAPERLGGCDVDASAFLLSNGKVMSDEGFVFYGNLSSPDGSVRLQPGGGRSQFQVDLERVPAAVEKIAFALTIHGGMSFSMASVLRFSVAGVAEFSPSTAQMSEAAVVLGEVYRRDGGWKCRAVGQGWNGGLAPLATHFGVDIADDGAAQSTGVPPPAQRQNSGLGKAVRDLFGFGQRETSSHTRAPAAEAAPAPMRQGGPVSLEKRQSVSLEKTAGRALSKVLFGLGWDAAEAGDSIDLDASVVLLDTGRNVLEYIYFGNLRSNNGSVEHTGDNLTGEGEGDDEQIRVDLGKLPSTAATLVFTINSYRGHKFSDVRNAFCRVVDENTGRELARYNLTQGPRCTAMVMAKVDLRDDGWHMTALGEAAEGKTVREILDVVKQHA